MDNLATEMLKELKSNATATVSRVIKQIKHKILKII